MTLFGITTILRDYEIFQMMILQDLEQIHRLQGITREFGDCEGFLHKVRSIFIKVLKLPLNFFRKVIVVLYGVNIVHIVRGF